MQIRFAPLVPFALTLLLGACASQVSQSISQPQAPVAEMHQSSAKSSFIADLDVQALSDTQQSEDTSVDFRAAKPYRLPSFAESADSVDSADSADSILTHGLSLVGTRYRKGGISADTGFDCSGFVGFLFREEAGIKLPRSTREMINLKAPLVARTELEPGDIIFFNHLGKGRVSHTGIYLGDDQFIHSSSSHSGGVRVDSLDDSYWKRSFIEAKRVLAMAPAQNRQANR